MCRSLEGLKGLEISSGLLDFKWSSFFQAFTKLFGKQYCELFVDLGKSLFIGGIRQNKLTPRLWVVLLD